VGEPRRAVFKEGVSGYTKWRLPFAEKKGKESTHKTVAQALKGPAAASGSRGFKPREKWKGPKHAIASKKEASAAQREGAYITATSSPSVGRETRDL